MNVLVECAGQAGGTLDAKVLFARQMADRGHDAIIDADTLPERMTRHQKYEALPFVRECSELSFDRIVVLDAGRVCGATQARLRRKALGPGGRTVALGRFASVQDAVSACSKIAYATGADPDLVDLDTLLPRPMVERRTVPALVPENLPPAMRDARKHLCFVDPDMMQDETIVRSLVAAERGLPGGLAIVTSGKAKEALKASRHTDLEAFSYAEITPEALARSCAAASFFGKGVPGDRIAIFVAQLLARGGLVLDGTESGSILASGAPVLRGPTDPAMLLPYLREAIEGRAAEIAEEIRASEWLRDNAVSRLEQAMGLALPPEAARPAVRSSASQRVLFIPTNGVGLGHAQRCAIVAGELADPGVAGFAAFPSCVPMLRDRGFETVPLVQKSEAHEDVFANDLVNHRRLSRTLRPGDLMVFDGGYVFDSILRATLERDLRAIWIRRGLWQPGQSNETALERSKIFSRILVPTEAFPELNDPPAGSDRVCEVGPIVQQADMDAACRSRLREALAARFLPGATRLVVTMLGGGVAADRSAQLQAICQALEGRTDVLNLLVVWPHAKISPSLHGWKNSIPVRTRHALQFCKASDFAISAAGYNSFHELLYNRIPAILVPQMAPYMDDQERRARAACDRGCGAFARAQDLWTLLGHLKSFLDGGEADRVAAALSTLPLPDPGQRTAAAIIDDMRTS
jgi:UDP:flavonoid glycosyltransferase YjiC (YdhE family)